MSAVSTRTARQLLRSLPQATASTSRSSSSSSSSSTPTTSADTTNTPSTPPTPTPAPKARRPDLPQIPYIRRLTPDRLRVFDPKIDLHPSLTTTPTSLGPSQLYPHTIVHAIPPTQPRPDKSQIVAKAGEEDTISHLSTLTSLSPSEIKKLHRYPLITKRVVQMTSKGKQPSMYSLVVVGNGNGLVGVGEGNDESAQKAVQKAFGQAVRSMDGVDRMEGRTVWGKMEGAFGSCKIQMRSRPPGFGLRVNHYIHQVAKAAGISDLSAKVHGSRNGTRVIKLACQMLQGGTIPLDMGEFGKKGQRKNKISNGMQSAQEVARMRGRKAVSL